MSSPQQQDPPRDDFDGFVALLRERGPNLPKRLRQVADYALANPDDMALSTAAQVAQQAGVQASTLVRFAQALDYSGFSELQQLFRSRLRQQFPDYRERLEALREKRVAGPNMAQGLLDGFVEASRSSLSRLQSTVRYDDIDQAADLLAKAETIILVGARRMFPVVSYLAYVFGKLGIRAVLIDNVASLGPEQAAIARKGDVVVALSCAPYTPATIAIAADAHRKGIPVIAVTDGALSPLAQNCLLWIAVEEADYGAFRSMTATFALAMTLAVGAAEKARSDA
ncbi:RpiR family transcriptional regulator [Bosea sp. Root483D1]|uniref:MurR/RpiR family transcriptional regulator n=1 Tax=Bosea sp. Root483D1 TaxID=1736544 RepID=UPI0007097531|nr:MurR/RpiR family transcriptional regulator [Bosea sp. Root483D1]KRE14634.1 RpiR family transcriptional regulator [Bosea sp. Root483D1]